MISTENSGAFSAFCLIIYETVIFTKMCVKFYSRTYVQNIPLLNEYSVSASRFNLEMSFETRIDLRVKCRL
jgi:hypothetical protein